jgi:hypothetical protein
MKQEMNAHIIIILRSCVREVIGIDNGRPCSNTTTTTTDPGTFIVLCVELKGICQTGMAAMQRHINLGSILKGFDFWLHALH